MTPSILLFACCVAVLAFLGALAYRHQWLLWRGAEITPRGYGVFLGPVLLAAAIASDAPREVVVIFAIVSVAAACYWLDDLRGLGIRTRIGISFATGAVVSACLLADGQVSWPFLVVSCLGAGILNVVLTNIVNFYDGADLNIATLIALFATLFLVFVPAHDFLTVSALACLAFTAGFAILNSRPKTIYFGDSGSFAFASFLTVVVIVYFRDGNLAEQVAVPMALPALDTFYVLCIRFAAKEDLTTRHYLHLYQRLNARNSGFGYLLPQIVNAGLVLAAAAALQAAGLSRWIAVVLAMVLVTVPFYFSCRKLLVPEKTNGNAAGT